MNNIYLKQGLSGHQLAMVQSEFEKVQKSKAVAYALWWFLCIVAGQRFYVGDTGRAIAIMLIGPFTMFIWNLCDVFAIGKRIEQINNEKEAEIITRVKAYGNGV